MKEGRQGKEGKQGRQGEQGKEGKEGKERVRARGFTLTEMLVASAIAAVMGGVLIAAFKSGQNSWYSGEAKMAASYELRRGVEHMSREICSTRSDQVNIAADGNWYGTLTFRTPADLDQNGTVLDSTGALEWSADTITYSLVGSQVVRTKGASTRVLANGVQTLQFRRTLANPQVVEIGMTVQRAQGGFQSQGSLTTRVRLRN